MSEKKGWKKIGEKNGFDNIIVFKQGEFTLDDLNEIVKQAKKEARK